MQEALEPTSTSRPAYRLGRAAIFSIFTSLIAAATVTLHFIGVVRHSAYLRYWGIDAGLFPKATDWLLINGYYGLVDRFVVILAAVLSNLLWVLVAAIALELYMFILLSPAAAGSGQPSKWLLRQPDWLRRMIRQVLFTGLIVSALPLVLFLLTAFMVTPAMLGERAGTAAAEAIAVEYAKGCEKSKYSCVQLKRDGGVIALGFIVEDSPAQVAIFDVELQRSRTIPRDGMEMIVNRIARVDPIGTPRH